MDNSNKQHKTSSSKKRSAHGKKVFIGIIVVLLFAAAGAGVWYFVFNQKKSSTDTVVLDRNVAISNAKTLANSGKIDEAAALYDKTIDDTADTYQKSILISNKATIYFNEGNYDEALKIARQAEITKPTDMGMYLIAQIYENLGNNQMAIEYYQKTIPLVDTTGPSSNDDIIYYEYMIKKLGGEVK